MPCPSFNATRAVTVHAPPEAIHPWIVQIGMTRAGWYSYDLLDNLGRPSATRLIPELQQIYAGQIIPMSPDGKYGVYVKEFKENEWILWNDKEGDTTWFWGLYPEGENRTRLVTRVRIKYLWNSPAALFNLLVEFADLPMMRKCLLRLKNALRNSITIVWSPTTKQPTDQRVNSQNEHDSILIQAELWNLDQDGKRNRLQQEQSHFHKEQPAALLWESVAMKTKARAVVGQGNAPRMNQPEGGCPISCPTSG